MTAAEGTPGLRPGDLVVAVDGVALEAWAARRGEVPLPERRPGDHLRYEVVREDRRLELDVVLDRTGWWEALAGNSTAVPVAVCSMAVGVLVFLRRPWDRVARLILVIAVLVGGGAVASPFVEVMDLVGGQDLRSYVADRVAVALMWGALFHFALIFPEPWLPPRRRRWLVGAGYAGPFVLHACYLAVTLPATSSSLERLGRVLALSFVPRRVYPVAVVAALFLGARAAPTAADRQRGKWVLVAFFASAALYLGLGTMPALFWGRPLVPEEWLPLAFLPCPLAIGAAILRYRLFDVELILKRSLIYAGLTAGVFAIYVAVIGLLNRAVNEQGALVPLVASAAVAWCIPALRDRLQRRVSRFIYGERDDPHEVVSRLSQRLEATASPEAILPGVVETLALTLRLPYAAIELHSPEGVVQATASHGTASRDSLSVPLVHRGQAVGRLLLEVGPGAEPFGPADRRLLEDLARQVAVTAHGLLLTLALQGSLERVVTAREEERRRLRRDLHDGLGPTLASAALQLDVARGLVRADATGAECLLGRLTTQIQTAIADLRHVIDGLRPQMLDQLGLVSAIEARARELGGGPGEGKPRAGVLEVSVETEGDLGSLPAAVEVAAFRIVTEALANAWRHGGATACTVRLATNGALALSVEDNGLGLPATLVAGVGIPSMRERAAELGGTCEIEAAPDGGTLVQARFPLPQRGAS
ncbi:MAG: histidine kinase [Actinomycetota bacterium]|nr:histidine kinase [Actinomycetota bacterium]